MGNHDGFCPFRDQNHPWDLRCKRWSQNVCVNGMSRKVMESADGSDSVISVIASGGDVDQYQYQYPSQNTYRQRSARFSFRRASAMTLWSLWHGETPASAPRTHRHGMIWGSGFLVQTIPEVQELIQAMTPDFWIHLTHLKHMDEPLQLVTSAMSLTPIAITALRHSAFYSPLL